MWDFVARVLKALNQPACSLMAGSYGIVTLYNVLALSDPRPHLYPGEKGSRRDVSCSPRWTLTACCAGQVPVWSVAHRYASVLQDWGSKILKWVPRKWICSPLICYQIPVCQSLPLGLMWEHRCSGISIGIPSEEESLGLSPVFPVEGLN